MSHKQPLLYIMRHAKSDRENFFGPDFDRPLTEQGLKQPVIVAQKLMTHHAYIDKAFISPSVRTKETWRILKQHINQNPDESFDPRLYNASVQDILSVVFEHGDDCICPIIVAHCPGVAELVNYLSGEYIAFNTADLAILAPVNKSLEHASKQPRGFRLVKVLDAHE